MEPPRPIYILGIGQRSGTHFLYDILTRHPQCRPALSRTSWEGSWEDHLLEFSFHLRGYADDVTRSNRFNDETTRALLLQSLGEGIDSFVRRLDGSTADNRRPVTKTPMSAHAGNFPALFPGAVLVLLVRDPRALVASALRTFGGPAQRWIREWRRGARRFLELQRDHPDAVALIRYEDLFNDTEATLHTLFTRLGLDAAYDYAAIAEMPVRGSAQLGGERRKQNWFPVARTADFDPTRRGDWLSPSVEAQIRRLALPEMRALGYAAGDERPPAATAALMSRAATAAFYAWRLPGVVEGVNRRVRRRLRR